MKSIYKIAILGAAGFFMMATHQSALAQVDVFASSTAQLNAQIAKLKAENAQLKNQIDGWKGEYKACAAGNASGWQAEYKACADQSAKLKEQVTGLQAEYKACEAGNASGWKGEYKACAEQLAACSSSAANKPGFNPVSVSSKADAADSLESTNSRWKEKKKFQKRIPASTFSVGSEVDNSIQVR